jgi:hypothetical protein
VEGGRTEPGISAGSSRRPAGCKRVTKSCDIESFFWWQRLQWE